MLENGCNEDGDEDDEDYDEDAMEKMILRFQLDAAQQSIIEMEKELAKHRDTNKRLQEELEEKAEIQQTLSTVIAEQHLLLSEAEQNLKHMESKQQSLEHLNEEMKKKLLCLLCKGRERDVVLLPCTHFAFCSVCLKERRKRRAVEGDLLEEKRKMNDGSIKDECPLCNMEIKGKLKSIIL